MVKRYPDYAFTCEETLDKYKYLFEYAPISIWEEDFSEVKAYLNRLSEQGVNDFAHYFDNHPEEITTIAGLVNIKNVNRATLKMFGVSSRDELLSNISSYFTSESMKIFIDEIVSFMNGSLTYQNLLPIQSLNGTPMILDLKANILPGYEENWDKVMVSFVDVTEQKQAQAALVESELKLKQSNSTKDKFFSIIAHDLKSPFNAILGLTNMLVEDFESLSDEKKKTMLGYIQQSIESSYKLFENLLMWSMSQDRSIPFAPSPENLHYHVQCMVELSAQSLRSKSITMVNNIPPDVSVMADENMLRTILRNLISNAIKFTPKKGTITLATTPVKKENGVKFLQISVADTGIGIPKHREQELFTLTKNLSTHGTDSEKGSGLGLILCKEFVEKHGGAIWLSSTECQGTVFNFTLPAAS